MNLGQLAPDLEEFVTDYKRLGYATRTQLVSHALRLLRQTKAREHRQAERDALLAEYAAAKPDSAWGGLDDEDFA